MKYGDFETWCFAILGGPPRFRFAIASAVSRKDDLKEYTLGGVSRRASFA
jgi:hypothetical protein